MTAEVCRVVTFRNRGCDEIACFRGGNLHALQLFQQPGTREDWAKRLLPGDEEQTAKDVLSNRRPSVWLDPMTSRMLSVVQALDCGQQDFSTATPQMRHLFTAVNCDRSYPKSYKACERTGVTLLITPYRPVECGKNGRSRRKTR